jgi:hypothetical protein
MNRDAAIDLLRRTPLTPGTVRKVAVPPAARALCTLSHVDYEDAFTVDIRHAQERTAEQWARVALEQAPAITRRALLRGWSALGLQLDPARSDGIVLGWEIQRSSPDFVLLGARSRLGLRGELLFKRQRQKLLYATFVQHENRTARAMWAGVEPVHVKVVRYLLGQAGGR